MRSSVDAILLCGGKGTRSGAKKNKVLCYFGVKTALEYCLDVFFGLCDNIIVVAAKDDYEEISAVAESYGAKVVVGGTTRFLSVKNGLKEVKSDLVLIHDAARPFVDRETVENCIASAKRYGSGIAAVKVADTVKRVNDGAIIEEIDRKDLYYMQTPQAFVSNDIKKAYLNASGEFNDDSAVYAAYGLTPHIVTSRSSNKKITMPEDLISTPPCQKIGTGIDFHRFQKGRKLILGGVNIDHEMGLVGNSDADVLTHAVMDALLSAIGEPDIGVLFPCTEEFRDADSIRLLETVMRKVDEHGCKVISVSGVIMAEKPKMKGYIPSMRAVLASAMKIDTSRINISATTTEGMGVIGEGNGIAASAVCLLQEYATAKT